MRVYEIAFDLAVCLMAALGCLIEVMRRQVHRVRYGEQEVGPWNARYVNDLFGRYGIVGLHRRFHERSCVRSWFWAVLVAFLISVAFGVLSYLSVRG